MSNNEYMYGITKELIDNYFKLLDDYDKLEKTSYSLECQLHEIYYPNPYKFEDLKPNMWIWNNAYKVFLKIIKIIEYGNTRELKVGDSHCQWYIEFEEGRFYPITKAMEVK